MTCRGRRGGGESGLLDWGGNRLCIRVRHFVILRSFNVGGGFFVFDIGGFALTALLGGGEEEAGFYRGAG